MQVSYTAGHEGFKVVSNDLPVGPTADLKAPVFTGESPKPVEDTAEVVEAKKVFFKKFDEAKSASTSESRKKRQILGYPYANPFAYSAPLAYAAPVAVEHTIKTAVLEPNAAEKTPAATTLLEEKEITQKVVSHHVAPIATPYAFGAYPYHYATPYVVATEAKKDRKKRQIPVVPANQFTADLIWDSVDLNQVRILISFNNKNKFNKILIFKKINFRMVNPTRLLSPLLNLSSLLWFTLILLWPTRSPPVHSTMAHTPMAFFPLPSPLRPKKPRPSPARSVKSTIPLPSALTSTAAPLIWTRMVSPTTNSTHMPTPPLTPSLVVIGLLSIRKKLEKVSC